MKITVIVLVWIGLIYGGFCIDRLIFNLIVDVIPVNEWLKLIKIGVGLVLFFLTAGFIIGVSSLITSLIANIMK